MEFAIIYQAARFTDYEESEYDPVDVSALQPGEPCAAETKVTDIVNDSRLYAYFRCAPSLAADLRRMAYRIL